jgi:hypothetical protein
VALSALTPFSQNVTNFSTAAQQIDGTIYQNSISFTVTQNSYVTYDVTGYNSLTAVIGIPDDVTDATGDVVSITFSQSDNLQLDSVTVSPDRPQSIDLNLQGSAQLVITCTAKDSSGQVVSVDVAFGNAELDAS